MKDDFYEQLRARFKRLLQEEGLEQEPVAISCRSLTPEEAIGKTRRQDFPIISGKDVMIEASFRAAKGQAFTDAPSNYQGSLADILALDLSGSSHDRAVFVAALNAVMAYLGHCCGTVHCRSEGPELCAGDLSLYLEEHYPERKRVALIGYQPAMLEMLSKSKYDLRVLDLSPLNIGEERYGVLVEDGRNSKIHDEIINNYADLILCTGSTICNGTILDYLDLPVETLFFGTTISGAAVLMGLKRVCFADKYE